LAFFGWLWARVWWFYLFACGTNGGSKPPPYTIYRLILWSDGRPPKTLSLFNAGKAVALIPRGQFAARPAIAQSQKMAHALFFANCPLVLAGSLLCFYCLVCILVLRFGDRGRCPQTPASLLARGLTARFFSLTALWFYRGFVGRLCLLKRLAFGHANNYEL